MANQPSTWDPVSLEIIWSRLISIVDEAAATVIRTSFSDIVREAHDFACMLVDSQGSCVANSTVSIPHFLGVISQTMKHVLAKFPQDTWERGDMVITNDAWMGTGHMRDITMARPIFDADELIAFSVCTAQMPDIGGSIWSADAREVFEEGLRILPVQLFRQGALNEDIMNMIRANVRVPQQVEGDLLAMAAALDKMANRLTELLGDEEVQDFDSLAETIRARAEESMRRKIAEIPAGVYTSEIYTDGIEDSELVIRCAVTVAETDIHVDYTGSSPQVDAAINSVLNHTFAYTAPPLKCLIDPFVPNNDGALRPLSVTAPEGSIVNALFPVAVDARSLVSHYLHAAIFSALEAAIPERVSGHCGGPGMRMVFSGLKDGRFFSATVLTIGGMGAAVDRDGLDFSFPTIAGCPPIEILERLAPIMFLEKRIIIDSGGPGRHRGGWGHRFRIKVLHDSPIECSVMAERVSHPPLGVVGGRPGSPLRLSLNGKEYLNPKGRTILEHDDVVTIDGPGGGGYGDPRTRASEAVGTDVANGRVSVRAAIEEYGADPEAFRDMQRGRR